MMAVMKSKLINEIQKLKTRAVAKEVQPGRKLRYGSVPPSFPPSPEDENDHFGV